MALAFFCELIIIAGSLSKLSMLAFGALALLCGFFSRKFYISKARGLSVTFLLIAVFFLLLVLLYGAALLGYIPIGCPL